MDYKTTCINRATESLPYVFSRALDTARTALSGEPKWPTTYGGGYTTDKLIAAMDSDPTALDDDTLAIYVNTLEYYRPRWHADCKTSNNYAEAARVDVTSLSDSLKQIDGLKAALVKALEARCDALESYERDAWASLERYDAKIEALKAEQESRKPMRMSELIDALKEQGIDVGRGKADAKGARVANKQRGVKNKAMKVFNKSM